MSKLEYKPVNAPCFLILCMLMLSMMASTHLVAQPVLPAGKQVIGIVPAQEGQKAVNSLKIFLQGHGAVIDDTIKYEDGGRLLKVIAPAGKDRVNNNTILAAIRKSRLVKWAGELQQNSFIETGQITAEMISAEAGASLRKALPPGIMRAEQEGVFLVLTVQPQVDRGIHHIAAKLKKMRSVKYVNVNVFPGMFLKD
jgi:hypothetical protein